MKELLIPGVASFIAIGLTTGLLISRAGRARKALLRKVDELSAANAGLNQKVDELSTTNARLNQKVDESYVSSIKALVETIDVRDHYIRHHSEHVSRYAVKIARQMGLSEEETEKIRHAAQLHDLGKLGIQDYILNKPEQLTEEEWKQIRQHTLKGARILKPIKPLGGVAKIVKLHHEHFNGEGYPDGLKGKKIPIGARIICVASAFDAMITERPYRKAKSYAEAKAELRRCAGTQFDPEVVRAFLGLSSLT